MRQHLNLFLSLSESAAVLRGHSNAGSSSGTPPPAPANDVPVEFGPEAALSVDALHRRFFDWHLKGFQESDLATAPACR